MASLFVKLDANFYSNPKARKVGSVGRDVYLFILTRHRSLDGTGTLPADNVDPDYLSQMLQVPRNECVTAVTACVTSKLIAVNDGKVEILGWDSEWSRTPSSGAERVAKHRKNKELAEHVTNRNVTDVTCNESNAREEKRREEKKRDLFTPSAPGEAEPAEPKAKKATKRALPEDWEPNAKHAAKAKELGLQLGKAVEEFRNYWGARGDTMKNWDLAFNTWLGNAVKFAARSGNGFQRPAEQKRHIPVFAFKTDPNAPDPIDELIKAL